MDNNNNLGKVTPFAFRRMAKSIASTYGDDGAIIITVGKEGTRVGIEGLTPQQIQDALCVAIKIISLSSSSVSVNPICEKSLK